MKWLNTKVLIPIITLIIGVIWIIIGISEYGFWTDKGPGGGFFPTLIGIVLILVSMFGIIQGLKEEKVKYDISIIYPIIACVSIIIVAQVIGLILSIFLYVVIWLKFIEKYSWKFSILVSIGLVVVVYGVFVLWLQIPFPKGYIYNNFIR